MRRRKAGSRPRIAFRAYPLGHQRQVRTLRISCRIGAGSMEQAAQRIRNFAVAYAWDRLNNVEILHPRPLAYLPI